MELHPNNLTTEVIEMQGDTGIHQVPGVFLDDDYDDLAQAGPMNIMFNCEYQNVLTVAWLELLFSIDTR